MRSLGCAVILLLGLVAGARGSREEFDRRLGTGIELYNKLEYEHALRELQGARPFAPSLDDEVRLGLYEGIVLAENGQLRAASAAFQTALETDPDAELPTQVAPKIAKRLEQARDQVRRRLGQAGVEKLRAEKRARAQAAPSEATVAESAPPAPAPAPPPAVEPAIRPEAATTQVSARPVSSLRSFAWIPAVAGVVTAGAGTALYLAARGNYQSIVDRTISVDRLNAVRATGEGQQIAAWSLFGLAGASLLTAGGMALFGAPPNAPAPTPWVGAHSAGVSLAGGW